MKKIVSLVLAISMVLSMFVSAFAATRSFEDIEDTKYAGAVEALVELGVIDGLPDGTYGPEKQVTRAQLAKMLVICLGLGDSVDALAGKTVFTDVADNHWASGYINAAVQSKVISGYPDGTFKPEKNVSYAEAVTMVIRALGYGNVVDTEGTWPTSYMLKAVELELLDDMDSPKAGDAALRGNVAILLWNMLRTPMWKIYEESEGNGMTSTAKADVLMLNVKFPDYWYVEDYYVYDLAMADNEVSVELRDENGLNPEIAKVEDVDLPRLLEGLKVSALIKNHEEDDAEFLTLTPAHTVVEGIVTDFTTDNSGAYTKVEIEGTEYKVSNLSLQLVKDETYLVAEVYNKKVNSYLDVAVAAELTKAGEEVEKLRSMEAKIDEEALVIIEGEWATRDDIKVGDVVTEMDLDGDGDTDYYMVARERVNGSFESYTREKNSQETVYFEVDGEEYRAFESLILNEVYEGEDNDKNVDVDDLEAAEKENKYLDHDVELVLNYLGQVVRVYFGEVSELNADGSFFAVMSNGAWATSSASGKQYHIVLAGVDGEEETYDFKNGVVPADLEEGSVYSKGTPVFIWANLNDDGEISKYVKFGKSLKSGDGDYKGDYEFVTFTGEPDDDNYLDKTYKVTASTIVLTVTPVKDDEDDTKVVGFKAEASQGAEALEGVTGGLVAWDTTKSNKRAKYVLLADEAESQDLVFGKVEEARQSRGIVYVTISGTEYEVDLESKASVVASYSDVKALYGMLVAFSLNDDEAIIKQYVDVTDLDQVGVVTEIDDEFVTIDGFAADPIDTTAEATVKAYEKYTFVLASVYADKENKLVFESDVEVLGEGIENATFRKGDRVTKDDTAKVVLIVTGLAKDDVVNADGTVK